MCIVYIFISSSLLSVHSIHFHLFLLFSLLFPSNFLPLAFPPLYLSFFCPFADLSFPLFLDSRRSLQAQRASSICLRPSMLQLLQEVVLFYKENGSAGTMQCCIHGHSTCLNLICENLTLPSGINPFSERELCFTFGME